MTHAVKTLRIATMIAALATAGGAYALDNGGFMKVADATGSTVTQANPTNTPSGMPGRSDGDKEKLPAATSGAKVDANVDNAKQAVTDSALTTKVKTKLLATKDLKSTGIHVKTKDRVVNLTGSVPSVEQRQMAVETVRSVEGVSSVDDHLKVSAR